MAATPPVTLSNFAGIDFNSILNAIIAGEKVPVVALQQQVLNENVAISSLGTINGDLSSLQSALNGLNTVGTSIPMTSTVTGTAFSATASSSAVAGTYNVTVNQLATPQVSASQGYASNTSTVGTGTITVTVGGTAHAITINSSNDTLDGVAGAINSANIGVTAAVVNTGLPGAPYRLDLSDSRTGAANTFSVSSSLSGGTAPDFIDKAIGPVSLDSVSGTSTITLGGAYSGSLTQGYHFTVTSGGTVGTNALTITYTSDSGASGTINVPSNYVAGSQIAVADGINLSLSSGTLNTGDKFSVAAFNPTISSAQNASVQIGNQIFSASTNAVSNAISGVTLNLTGTGAGTVTVAEDSGSEAGTISLFVSAYNKLQADIQVNTQPRPGRNLPPLANDGTISSILLGAQLALSPLNLSKLGITEDSKTGELTFNQSTYSSSLGSDPSGTHALFGSVYNALNTLVTDALNPASGAIASDTNAINGKIANQNLQIAQLNNQIAQEQDILTAEFAQIQAQALQFQTLSQEFFTTSGSSSSGSSSSAPGSNLNVNA